MCRRLLALGSLTAALASALYPSCFALAGMPAFTHTPLTLLGLRSAAPGLGLAAVVCLNLRVGGSPCVALQGVTAWARSLA